MNDGEYLDCCPYHRRMTRASKPLPPPDLLGEELVSALEQFPQLAQLGSDWAVWRPADLYNGHIETKLKEIS
jgi:hypothetical protein